MDTSISKSPAPTKAKVRHDLLRNEQGGLAVDVEEIRQAFADFDVDRKLYLERAELTALFNMLFPDENHREDVRELCGTDGLTLEKLEELLINNTLTDFDPVQAAFDAVDVNRTGVLELNVLMQKFQQMPNVGPVDFDDLMLFRNHTDLDRDGAIGFDDFVAIGTQKLVPVPVEEEELKKEQEPAGPAQWAGAEGVAPAGEATGGEGAAPEDDDDEAAVDDQGARGDGEAQGEGEGGTGAAPSQPEMA